MAPWSTTGDEGNHDLGRVAVEVLPSKATVIGMSAPRVDQINVVVSDVEGAARFLTGLGVDLPANPRVGGAPSGDPHSDVTARRSRSGRACFRDRRQYRLRSALGWFGPVVQWRRAQPARRRAVRGRPPAQARPVARRPVARDALRRVLGLPIRRRPHERAGSISPRRPTRSCLVGLSRPRTPTELTCV